ncbi:MAG TPA: NADH-quinone oxidoreductase subunit D [Streptosporangiaceae bacterium]|nr:NADH-quinone oxidoreductase subunit D [Streptosporangiaceae bacterium]
MAERIAGVATGAAAWGLAPAAAPDHTAPPTPSIRQQADDLVLDIGPQHPSTHGVLRLSLALDGDRIMSAKPVIGYLHRGAEKLFEVRDYRQIIMLANRHDWLGAFANELGIVLAAERLLGLQVPERGVWARTLLAELNRALSHLMFLGCYPEELCEGAREPAGVPGALQARETLQAVMEEISGGRMHYMFNRVGGLKDELPLGWLDRVRASVADTRAALAEIEAIVFGSAAFRRRTRGIGGLTRDQVLQYGVSGPVARAAAVDFDLRRDEPYLAYGELGDVLRIATRRDGDCLARFECLLDQLAVSLDLADACARRLASLPRGPVHVRLPKVVKVPEGHAYAWTEAPLGISGYYLVSKGDKTPWRLKLRTPSFSNVQALTEMLPGSMVSDLVPILGSMFFIVGDIDK